MRSKYIIIFCGALVIIFYNMQNYQHEETMLERRAHPFDSITESNIETAKVGYLPDGILEPRSDLEVKSLWGTKTSQVKLIIVGEKRPSIFTCNASWNKSEKKCEFYCIEENFTVILFHYDGNVDDWHSLKWSENVIHISAINQTKWWFAKRFLHPDVVSKYDYVFFWDENVRVENFLPRRYVNVMKSDGLEVSHPVLDPKSPKIYHQINIHRKEAFFHRRKYNKQGSGNCNIAEGPTCTRWVEGIVLVLSRSAWKCAWHHIQNDPIHGWEFDIKFGYCLR